MKRITNKNNKAKNKTKTKSKKSPKRIIILFVIIIIIILLFLVSNMCNIKNIEINIISQKVSEGEKNKLNDEEIIGLVGLSKGQNMFEKSSKSISDSIKTNQYVENVNIEKKLNGTLKIEVTERKTKYMINYAGAYIYIDSNGYVLELNKEAIAVPVLLGVSTDFSSLAVGNGEKIIKLNDEDMDKLSMVNNIMDISKNNEVDNLISRIDMTDNRDYIVYLDSKNKTVYLGNCKDLNTRILYMKSIVQKETGIKGEIYINADLDSGYVYFKESV